MQIQVEKCITTLGQKYHTVSWASFAIVSCESRIWYPSGYSLYGSALDTSVKTWLSYWSAHSVSRSIHLDCNRCFILGLEVCENDSMTSSPVVLLLGHFVLGSQCWWLWFCRSRGLLILLFLTILNYAPGINSSRIMDKWLLHQQIFIDGFY